MWILCSSPVGFGKLALPIFTGAWPVWPVWPLLPPNVGSASVGSRHRCYRSLFVYLTSFASTVRPIDSHAITCPNIIPNTISFISSLLFLSGPLGRPRSCNLCLKRALLCHLSYERWSGSQELNLARDGHNIRCCRYTTSF